MRFPMILAALAFLLAGCSTPEPEPSDPRPFFCANTEDSRFTQEEIDVRTANGWTRNLAISFRVNERRDRWCVGDA